MKNKKLLEEVATEIEEMGRRNPRGLKTLPTVEMGCWIVKHRGCGTAACVAGWIWLRDNLHKELLPAVVNRNTYFLVGASVGEDVRDLLDLRDWEARSLFFVQEWPEEIRNQIVRLENALLRMRPSKRTDEHQQVCNLVATRIRQFSRTGR